MRVWLVPYFLFSYDYDPWTFSSSSNPEIATFYTFFSLACRGSVVSIKAANVLLLFLLPISVLRIVMGVFLSGCKRQQFPSRIRNETHSIRSRGLYPLRIKECEEP